MYRKTAPTAPKEEDVSKYFPFQKSISLFTNRPSINNKNIQTCKESKKWLLFSV
jgi:hypothetical protein